MLFISTTGLIVCIILKKKNKKAFTFILISILTIPIIVEAATYSYNIYLITNYGLYDKNIITYVVDGEENTLNNKYDTKITGLETPTKDGYTFTKWTYEDGSDFDPNEPITEDIKIIANFSKDTYTFSYDLDGGTTNSELPTSYTITDKIELPNPTKEHYEFIGWTGTGIDEPTKDLVIENSYGDKKLVANYEPIDYTITYTGLTEEEKRLLNNPNKYNIETNTFRLNNPSNRIDSDGDITEIFVGWKEDTLVSNNVELPSNNSMGNKTYEAIWTQATPNTYTITYNYNNGTITEENKTSFTKYDETFTLNNPSKTGYTFKGWSGTDLVGDTNTLVKVEQGTRKNLSFVANYTPNNYQIKFDKNGDNVLGTMNNQILTYDIESNLNSINYIKEGYTFNGWNTKSDKTGTHYNDKQEVINLTSTKDEVITLYAEWIPNTYEIEFISNRANSTGTMNNLDMTYDTPKSLPLNMYEVVGYEFDSWNTKADGTGTKITNGSEANNLATTGIVKLYAQWSPKKYTIVFDKNDAGASGEMSNQIITYDVSTKLNKNTYTKEGYTFTGWNTKEDGTGTSYTDEQVMSDIVESKELLTLYAMWEKNKTLLYSVSSVGSYVEYKPTTTSYTPNSINNVTGTLQPTTATSWRVLSKNSDGTIDLISTNNVGTLTFGKSEYNVDNSTYAYLENTFEGITNSYINSTYASSARIPSENDLKTIKNSGLIINQDYILNKKDYESRSWTGEQEGGVTWNYYIYYANNAEVKQFKIWYKYAGTGGQSSDGYSITLGIRPIVRLKANIYTDDGTGASSSPYKITN